MCVPEEYRSIEGQVPDKIYEHFAETDFCNFALNDEIVKYMATSNGKLRKKLDYLEIMMTLEAYVTQIFEINWEFRQYAMEDFYPFLVKNNGFEGIPKEKWTKCTMPFLLYYVGVAALDEAYRLKLI